MAELNKNELEAMRILWEQSPLKPAEIQERFGWPIDNGTLRSVLALLIKKDVARREKKGKAYFYSPLESRAGMLSAMSRRMARIFTQGSTGALILQLLENERLSKQEIEELRKIAGDKASDLKKGE